MFKLPNTLAFRLAWWYSATSVAFLSLALLILYVSIDTIMEARKKNDMQEDLVEFSQMYLADGLPEIKKEIVKEFAGNVSEDFLRVFNKHGELIYSSDISERDRLILDAHFFQYLRRGTSDVVAETVRLPGREFGTKVVYGFIAQDLLMQIGESMEEQAEILELLRTLAILVFFIGIPLASAVGWFIARQAVHGINEVSRAAADIKKGDFGRRVAIQGQRDEVQGLANTFNAMAERINELITEMREMTDNITHDLRSPLARIRAISESALSGEGSVNDYKNAASSTLEECDRLIQMINTALDVAEVEAGTSRLIMKNVDMTELVRDALELYEPIAENNQIELSATISENCKIIGIKQNLQRMLMNLLDNALKYTPPEGKVLVSLDCTKDMVIIAVSDTGIGIPPIEQQRIFDRFYRCDQSRSLEGCGMGLSFARAVARAHDGDIQLKSEANIKTTFTVNLPRSL